MTGGRLLASTRSYDSAIKDSRLPIVCPNVRPYSPCSKVNIWRKLLKYLIYGVIIDSIDVVPKRLAGADALARHSMLSPPKHPIYAVEHRDWSTVDLARACPEPEDGMAECQLWSYSPSLEEQSCSVDPLSLSLALGDDQDERVQSAIEEMMAELHW